MGDMMDIILNGEKYAAYARSNVIGNDRVNGYTVDTCKTLDEGLETAIQKDDGDWIIVQRYQSQGEAQKGHGKWVRFCKGNPKSAYSVQYKRKIDF